MHRIFLVLVIASLLLACKKKDEDQFYINFSPAEDVILVSQERLALNLKLYSSEGLASLEIYMNSSQTPEFLYESRTFGGSKIENIPLLIEFAPQFNRGDIVYARFVATDINGETVEYLKRMDLTVDVALSLYEDLSFYSIDSELFNAFSLSQTASITWDGSNTGGNADLAELSNDTTDNPYELTYKWYSPTQCGIARIPNLNFYEVTKEQLGVIFDANVCMDYTDSLVVGDVYVFKKLFNSLPTYYTIRITGFESGATPGRYIFDLRK